MEGRLRKSERREKKRKHKKDRKKTGQKRLDGRKWKKGEEEEEERETLGTCYKSFLQFTWSLGRGSDQPQGRSSNFSHYGTTI